MMGLPPLEVGAVQVSPTIPDAVTAALFANYRGAVGTEPALMDTSFENIKL